MAQQKIQLRVTRDFGQNISDTFQFIRQEFKPLATAFILIAGIFILAHSIISGLYQTDLWAVLGNIEPGRSYENTYMFDNVFTLSYFLILFFAILNIVVMRTVISAYMKLYDENGTSPTVMEVWKTFLKYFPKVFLIHIPVLIMVAIGFIFCLAPGIYFMIVLLPITLVIVNEENNFGDAVSRCFYLIKENFWTTFATYLVAYIIYSFGSGIIGLIISVIFGAGSYFTTKELSGAMGIGASVLNFITYIFYIVFYISVSLHYYNMVEAKEGIGLSRRLENLGGNTNINTIEEQY